MTLSGVFPFLQGTGRKSVIFLIPGLFDLITLNTCYMWSSSLG